MRAKALQVIKTGKPDTPFKYPETFSGTIQIIEKELKAFTEGEPDYENVDLLADEEAGQIVDEIKASIYNRDEKTCEEGFDRLALYLAGEGFPFEFEWLHDSTAGNTLDMFFKNIDSGRNGFFSRHANLPPDSVLIFEMQYKNKMPVVACYLRKPKEKRPEEAAAVGVEEEAVAA